MKKIKLFALAVMAMLSTNVFAASEKGKTFIGSNGVEYQITKDYVAATAGVPEELGQVTVIRYAYSSQSDAVVIPEQVQNLDNSVAVDLTHKFKVVGIDGVETTEKTVNSTFVVNTTTAHQPFKDAAATSVTLPATIMYIGQKAFEGFKGSTVVIPAMSNLVVIEKGAFANAANLATFDTSNTAWLEEIGADAFYGCAKLTSITVGAKLKKIDAGAFVGTGITSLDLSACALLDGTNGINRLFTGAKGAAFASALTLGTATKYVAADATNAKLTTVVLPTTNTTDYSIAANAFDGCTKLATIGTTANKAIIPAKVASIGAGAFLNTAITVFDLSGNENIDATAAWFSTKPASGTDLSKLQQVILNKDVAYTAFTGLADISTLKKVGIVGAEYALPAGTKATTAIADGVFAGTALEQLDLSKVTTAVVTFPTIVKGITTLTAVVINDQTTAFKAEAFYGCTSLSSLTVKDKDGVAKDLTKITAVNTGAFYRTALSSLTFGDALATFDTPWAINLTDAADETKAALPYSTATSLSVDMSACTTNFNAGIPANTFQKVAALTSIKLPTGLIGIGANAFEGTGLTEVALPATIDQNDTPSSRGIGPQAFKDCASLTKISFYPTTETASIFTDNTVFVGCSMVGIYVTSTYAAIGGPDATSADTKKIAPTYSKWVTSSAEELTTVKDKVHPYAMKGFYSDGNYRFDATECQVYEGYIDGENVVMSPLQKRNGKYNVPANSAVIIRTAEATTLKPLVYTPGTGDDASSLVYGRMAPSENVLKSVLTETPRASVYQNYMYVLVNNATAGFSFQHFTGTKINKGNIYVINPNNAPAGARMNIVWLDENGNVESDATAIQTVENVEAEDGAIYNLQGARVNGAQKGIYIKNGKKFIVK